MREANATFQSTFDSWMDRTPTPVEPPTEDGPTAAGIAVVAADTGRVLLLQRNPHEANDPAAGKWEFPGGHLETYDEFGEDTGAPYEDPWVGAVREWQEEVGMRLPQGVCTGSWVSPNGVYQGFVWQVPAEELVQVNNDPAARHVLNPDDPDMDSIETVDWWDPELIPGNNAVRKELLEGTPFELLDVVFDPMGFTDHYPAGTPGGKGGEFAPKHGGQLDANGNDVPGTGGEKPKPKVVWKSGWHGDSKSAQVDAKHGEGKPKLKPWENWGKGHGQGHSSTPGGSNEAPKPEKPKGVFGWLHETAKPGTALRAMVDDPKVQAAEKANIDRGDVRRDKGVMVGFDKYSDAAWAENEHIAHSFINPASVPPAGVAPTAVIMLGRPGSGKSTLIHSGAVQLPETTKVNSDDIQEKLPGYDPMLSGAFHKRATDVAKLAVRTALKQRVNILYDMTGRDPHQMEGIAKDLKHAGYNIQVVHAKTDAETANARVHQRFLTTGRYVTPALLADHTLVSGPDTSYKMLQKYASTWHQFDTTNGVQLLNSGSAPENHNAAERRR